MGRQLLAEGGEIPGPEHVVVDEAVQPGGGGVFLRRDGAHHGVGDQIDSRPLHLPDIEFAHTPRVEDRDLDVETIGRIPQGFDRACRGERQQADPREEAGAGIPIGGRPAQAPVSGFRREWGEILVEQPGIGGVVEVR